MSDHNEAERQRALFIAWFEERRRAEPRFSIRGLARRANVSEGMIRAYLSGKTRSMTSEKLSRITRAEDGSQAMIFGYSALRHTVRWAPVLSQDMILQGLKGRSRVETGTGLRVVPVPTERTAVYAVELRDDDQSANLVVPPGGYAVYDADDVVPLDGGLYVAKVNGQLVIRIWRNSDGPTRFEAASTANYQTIYPAQGYRIIGRVIHAGREVRLPATSGPA